MKILTPLLLVAALGCFSAQADPSAKEKEIIAHAKPGVPITLPDRKSDVVVKLPFPTTNDLSESRLLRHSAKKSSMQSSTRVTKIQGFWFGGGEGKPRVVINLSSQVV